MLLNMKSGDKSILNLDLTYILAFFMSFLAFLSTEMILFHVLKSLQLISIEDKLTSVCKIKLNQEKYKMLLLLLMLIYFLQIRITHFMQTKQKTLQLVLIEDKITCVRLNMTYICSIIKKIIKC